MAEAGSYLDKEKRDHGVSWVEGAVAAKKKTGKSIFAQLKEAARLTLANRRLSLDEYYYYRLYDDEAFTFEDKTEFLGMRAQIDIIGRCNPVSWREVAHDKLLFHAVLKGLDLPAPAIYALYHPSRSFGPVRAARTAEELAALLRGPMPYPFFSKPVHGMFSVGAVSAAAYEAEADSLVLNDGNRVEIGRFVADIGDYAEGGYLFQERLTPHPRLAEACGQGLGTVRLIIGLSASGPFILHALWKIIAGGNVADNFWRTGNMLGYLDPDRGEVVRVVQGAGPAHLLVDNHPDTGQALKGLTLPDWTEAVKLCLGAAPAFPGLRLQAWDVALTDKGPVLVELNIGGDFNLPQLARGRGLMDQRFREFVESCGTGGGKA